MMLQPPEWVRGDPALLDQYHVLQACADQWVGSPQYWDPGYWRHQAEAIVDSARRRGARVSDLGQSIIRDCLEAADMCECGMERGEYI